MIYSIYIGDPKRNDIVFACIRRQRRVCEELGLDYTLFNWSSLVELFPLECRYFSKLRDIDDTARMRSMLSDWFRFAVMLRFLNRDLWYLDADIDLTVGTLPKVETKAELYTCFPNAIWYARAKKERPVTAGLTRYLLGRLKQLMSDSNGNLSVYLVRHYLRYDLRDVIGYNIVRAYFEANNCTDEDWFYDENARWEFRHMNANSWRN